MNSTQPTVPPARRWSIGRWIAAVVGVSALIVTLAVANVVTLSRDAAALRAELFSALDLPASTRVQISVGPALLTLARTAVAFIDDVPPEAHQILRTLRSASVGVYALNSAVAPADRTALLAAADDLMNRRAWTRIVGVSNPDATVLVYMPEQPARFGPERVCVAVCDEENVIIVSATVKRDALVEFLQQQQPRFARMGL